MKNIIQVGLLTVLLLGALVLATQKSVRESILGVFISDTKSGQDIVEKEVSSKEEDGVGKESPQMQIVKEDAAVNIEDTSSTNLPATPDPSTSGKKPILTVTKVDPNLVFDFTPESPPLNLKITLDYESIEDLKDTSVCQSIISSSGERVTETDCVNTLAFVSSFPDGVIVNSLNDLNLAPDLSHKEFWSEGTHSARMLIELRKGDTSNYDDSLRERFPLLAKDDSGPFTLNLFPL